MNRRGRAGAVVALALGLSLAGCAAQGEADADGSAVPDSDVAVPDTGAPEECAGAFPQAIGIPDLADVEALPADWPDPPTGSTLCLTASALGQGAVESLSYVTDASPDDVLTHYESLLTGYELGREPGPTGGEMLVGDGAAVSFQLRAGDGTIVIALAAVE